MAADKQKILIRYSFIVLFFGLIGIAIIVKATFIMFAERQYWNDVANRFKRENVIIKPNRGNILSSDGKLMASSLPEYKIYFDFIAGGIKKDTMLINHLDEICNGLHRILPDKSASSFKRHILKGRRKGSRNYLLYPNRITYIQYKEIKKLPLLSLSRFRSGLIPLAFNQRKKPFGSLASRTLGDLYPDKSKGAKNGLELAYDSLLRGEDGITHRQKVMNKYLSIVDKPAVDGCDIISTIDISMQDICEKALRDKLKEINADIGVAILMKVNSGEIKAIVNLEKCNDGIYREIKNHAISDLLESGSTFKTASIMVALEDRRISLNDGVDTKNGIRKMYGRYMRDHNWRRGGYQYLTVPEIMMMSSNIGVSVIIDSIYKNNPEKFVEGLYRMSLNRPLELDIPGEGKPYIRKPKDGHWYKTTLPWMSIGYETLLPPINMLTFYNAIANNGEMVKPKFIKEILRNGETIETSPTEIINPQICSEETLAKIKYILRRVVSEGVGKPANSKQFSISGKTGTAQVAKGGKGYKTGKRHYHVSFCGFFPSENPQYTCIVSIQKPNLPAGGGLMAGSVFKKIAERIYAKNLRLAITKGNDANKQIAPYVKSGDFNQTKIILNNLGIPSKINSINTIKTNWIKTKTSNDSVIIKKNQNSFTHLIPNVVGYGAKDAVYILEEKGLKVNLVGSGKVRRQSIMNGKVAHKGQIITLYLR